MVFEQQIPASIFSPFGQKITPRIHYKNLHSLLQTNLRMELIKKHKKILLISFSFGILYSLISLVNHYCFRTYALDLGLYTNALFKYAHFQLADSTMIKEYYEILLGGHFDLYLILFSPLIYLFGTYSLLIVQIIALIIGGIGVYNFFELSRSKNKIIPILATIYFYSFFGVFGALSFDYHSVVIASCIVPWFFISVRLNKKALSTFLLVLMLVSQENISLWVFFICLGLVIEYRNNTKKVYHLLLLSCISFIYFIAVISFIIPYFSATNEYSGFLYSSIGNNTFDAFKSLLTNPIDNFKILFTNHNNSVHGDFVKTELHIILFASGLPLLIKKPQYILMLVPIYFQKLFHDNNSIWGIGSQYNIEFAPIMAIGIFMVISEFNRVKLIKGMSVIILFFTIASTFRTMDNTICFTDKSRIRFYQRGHYKKDYDVISVHRQLSKIPKDAIVSAQSPFVPHLSLRKNIYQFPIIKNADYIIYFKNENCYPLTKEEFDSNIIELEHSKDWIILYNESITILKKISL